MDKLLGTKKNQHIPKQIGLAFLFFNLFPQGRRQVLALDEIVNRSSLDRLEKQKTRPANLTNNYQRSSGSKYNNKTLIKLRVGNHASFSFPLKKI